MNESIRHQFRWNSSKPAPIPQFSWTTSGRYEHLNSDEYRLLGGMQRIGYDADTQTYIYRDADGSVWKGEEGNQYGQLHRVGWNENPDRQLYDPNPHAVSYSDGSDPGPIEENRHFSRPQYPLAPPRGRQSQQEYRDWRYLLPFFLIVCVILLLLFKLMSSGPGTRACPEGTESYAVKTGDTCWSIGKGSSGSVEELHRLNDNLKCDRLVPEMRLCVPGEGFVRERQ